MENKSEAHWSGNSAFSVLDNQKAEYLINDVKKKKYEKYLEPLSPTILDGKHVQLVAVHNSPWEKHSSSQASMPIMDTEVKNKSLKSKAPQNGGVKFGFSLTDDEDDNASQDNKDQKDQKKESQWQIAAPELKKESFSTDENKNENENESRTHQPFKSELQQIDDLALNWDHPSFQAKRLPYSEIKKLVSERIKLRCEIAFLIAPKVWDRTLKSVHKIHRPDIFVHPVRKLTMFPTTPALMEKALKEGYIPLAPGDAVRYKLKLGGVVLPGADHVALYVGAGMVVHLMREKKVPGIPNLGFVILEHISKMYSKGSLFFTPFEDSQPKKSRAEVIRRALSTIGPYAYSLQDFNCHNVLLSWKDEPAPVVGWGVAVWYLAIILASLFIVVLLLLLFCYHPS